MQRLNGRQASVTLPDVLMDAIDDIAAQNKLTRARTLRVLLVSAVLRDWSEKGMVLETEDEDLGALVKKMLGSKE